jgi:magnesium transporter
MREAVSSLMRRESVAVSEELYPYFQDVYDHILRVSESSDSLRDLVATIVETSLSLRDYRQTRSSRRSAAGRRSSPCRPWSPATTA